VNDDVGHNLSTKKRRHVTTVVKLDNDVVKQEHNLTTGSTTTTSTTESKNVSKNSADNHRGVIKKETCKINEQNNIKSEIPKRAPSSQDYSGVNDDVGDNLNKHKRRHVTTVVELDNDVVKEEHTRPTGPTTTTTATAKHQNDTKEAEIDDIKRKPVSYHWYGEYSPTRSIYRISQHSREAALNKEIGGKWGQCPAQWCIKNGWITIMTRCIPDHVNSGDVKAYLCNTKKDDIKKACQNEQFWGEMKKEQMIMRYISTDRHFVSMKTGDIVALRVPGPTRKGVHCFGVIESDEIEVWNHERLIAEGWPCKYLLTESPWWCTKRIMLRKVKWLRWGMTRYLPEQTPNPVGIICAWLSENSPIWLVANPKEALRVMSGDDFILSTYAL
jgi:hypothetical protein